MFHNPPQTWLSFIYSCKMEINAAPWIYPHPVSRVEMKNTQNALRVKISKTSNLIAERPCSSNRNLRYLINETLKAPSTSIFSFT